MVRAATAKATRSAAEATAWPKPRRDMCSRCARCAAEFEPPESAVRAQRSGSALRARPHGREVCVNRLSGAWLQECVRQRTGMYCNGSEA